MPNIEDKEKLGKTTAVNLWPPHGPAHVSTHMEIHIHITHKKIRSENIYVKYFKYE